MTRTTPYKSFKKRTGSASSNTRKMLPESPSVDPPKKPSKRGAHLVAYQVQKGQVLNPAGRTKGSRNRFAEEFVKDFLTDWEEHGTEVLAVCRSCDPAAYLKVAATLLPKDLNINMTDEAALDKLLNQFDDKQLSELIGTLASIGAAQALRAKTIEGTAITEPDKIH